MPPPRSVDDARGTGGRRPGARPGRPDTKSEILRAARLNFARGYAHSSLRQVAKDAGVDPALIVHYFGGKDGLFLAAMSDVMRPAEGLAVALAGDERPSERLAAYFLSLWENEETRSAVQALLISAASHPSAARLLSEFVDRELVGRLAQTIDGPSARLRAAFAGSQLIGFAFARYVVGVPPLKALSVKKATEMLAHRIEAALDPSIDL